MAESPPHLIMVAGPNGSGKSTLIDALRASSLELPALYINADVLQREHAMENSLEAQRLATSIRDDALSRRADLMYETVMSHPSKIAELQRAASAGYHVAVHIVATGDPDINVQRVGVRVAAGGHDVPEDRIRERYKRTLALAPVALSFAHVGSIFDNTAVGITGDGLMEQATLHAGCLIPTVAAPAQWVQHLIEQVNRRADELHAFTDGGRAYGLIPRLARIDKGSTMGPLIAVGEHFVLQYDETSKSPVLHDRVLLEEAIPLDSARQPIRIGYKEGVARLHN